MKNISFFCLFLLVFSHVHAAWYSSSWTRRQKITIQGSAVSGILTNYPAFITITNSTELSNFARSDGNDILFTDFTGTNVMDYEIEDYSIGTLYAWIRFPFLTNNINSEIYLYYANSGQSTSLANPANVWDSNYQMVIHCSQVSGNLLDSTGKGFSGVSGGAGIPNYRMDSLIGKNVQTSLTAQNYWSFSSNIITNTNFNIEFWWRPEPVSNSTNSLNLLYKGAWSVAGIMVFRHQGGATYYRWANPPAAYNEVALSHSVVSAVYKPYDNNSVHYFSMDGDGGIFTIWINGWLPASPRSNSAIVQNTSSTFYFGPTAANGIGWGLSLDELRVSYAPRGSNYSATVFTNLRYPQNFIFLDVPESCLGIGISNAHYNLQPYNQNMQIILSGSGFSNSDSALLYKTGVFKTALTHSGGQGPGEMGSNTLVINPYSIASLYGEGLFQLRYVFTTNALGGGPQYAYTNTSVSFYFSRYFIAPVTNLAAEYQEDGVQISFSLDDTLRAIIGSFEIWRYDGQKTVWLLNSMDKNLSTWKDTYVSYGDSFTYQVINNMTDGLVSFTRTNSVIISNIPNTPIMVRGVIGTTGGAVGNLIGRIHFPPGVFSADTICSVIPVSIPPVATDTTPTHAYRVFDFSAEGYSFFSLPVTISYIFPIISEMITLDTSPRRVTIPYTGQNDLGIYWWSALTRCWQLMTTRQEYLSNQTGSYIRIFSDVNHLSMFGIAPISGNSTFPCGKNVKIVNAFFCADSTGAGAVTFFLNNIAGDTITLHIYSLKGQLMYTESAEKATVLSWNGRDTAGSIVPNGLYVYYLYYCKNSELSVNGVIGKMESDF